MESKNYLQDITDIKDMMSRSTQYFSLSGLAGVLAGVYALAASAIAYRWLQGIDTTHQLAEKIFMLAIAVLVLSLSTALLLTYRKASARGESFWNPVSRRMAFHFSIPFVAGGLFTIILLGREAYDLAIASTLIFYGLACVNGAKFTFGDIRYLGITMTALGLLAAALPEFALLFWAIGFGGCHIVYGGMMYYKYERKQS